MSSQDSTLRVIACVLCSLVLKCPSLGQLFPSRFDSAPSLQRLAGVPNIAPCNPLSAAMCYPLEPCTCTHTHTCCVCFTNIFLPCLESERGMAWCRVLHNTCESSACRDRSKCNMSDVVTTHPTAPLQWGLRVAPVVGAHVRCGHDTITTKGLQLYVTAHTMQTSLCCILSPATFPQ